MAHRVDTPPRRIDVSRGELLKIGDWMRVGASHLSVTAAEMEAHNLRACNACFVA
jgi:hypothetical protein